MSELVGRNTEEKIWNYLLSKGYSKAGISAIMGNLNAESGLSTNNLEDIWHSKLGSDTYYTAAINSGIYTKNQFINDRAGYGLAQWTYYTRKRGLYEMTIEQGLSIADLKGQLDYLIKELEGYSYLNNLLKTTNNVNDASDIFLKDFEAPAILNYKDRRDLSWMYYNRYCDGMPTNANNDVNPDECEYETYEVKANDTWWNIAAKKLGSGTKMYELAKFNNRTVKVLLHPGDILMLPTLRKEIIEAETKAKPVVTPTTKLYTFYEVKTGDSWWKIAAKKLGNGNRMAELAKFNGRNTVSILRIGEVIKIPCESQISNNTRHKYTTYTVKKGDSWHSIASKELGSATRMIELADFNNKTIKTILHPGNVLKIPK